MPWTPEKRKIYDRERWANDPDYRLKRNMRRYLYELRQGMEAKHGKLNQLIGEVHNEEED